MPETFLQLCVLGLLGLAACSTPYVNALPFFCLWQSIYPSCWNHPASLLFINGEEKDWILVPARGETCLLGRDVTVLTACCTHGSHGNEHVLNSRAAWLCIPLAHCLNTNLIISVPKMHLGGRGSWIFSFVPLPSVATLNGSPVFFSSLVILGTGVCVYLDKDV